MSGFVGFGVGFAAGIAAGFAFVGFAVWALDHALKRNGEDL